AVRGLRVEQPIDGRFPGPRAVRPLRQRRAAPDLDSAAVRLLPPAGAGAVFDVPGPKGDGDFRRVLPGGDAAGDFGSHDLHAVPLHRSKDRYVAAVGYLSVAGGDQHYGGGRIRDLGLGAAPAFAGGEGRMRQGLWLMVDG